MLSEQTGVEVGFLRANTSRDQPAAGGGDMFMQSG
jgi:hypothetical protein